VNNFPESKTKYYSAARIHIHKHKLCLPLKLGRTLLYKTSVVEIASKNGTRTGVIDEVLPYHQYQVKMDGSGRLCLCNRRFLKPIPSPTKSQLQMTTTVVNLPPLIADPTADTALQKHLFLPRPVPRMLCELQDSNKPGLTE